MQVAGIIAGVLIYWGGRKTRRTEVVEERLRMALQMERDPQRSAHNGSVPTINVEEAGESPESVSAAPPAPAPIAEPSSLDKGMATAQDTERLQAAVLDADTDGARHAENRLKAESETQIPAAERNPSARSLHFADEMVVPPAEHLAPPL